MTDIMNFQRLKNEFSIRDYGVIVSFYCTQSLQFEILNAGNVVIWVRKKLLILIIINLILKMHAHKIDIYTYTWFWNNKFPAIYRTRQLLPLTE